LVALTIYLDESGVHRDSKAVTVAGFVSTAERWVSFEREWRDALSDYGLPSFHMVDFAALRGPYSHWQDAQQRIRFGRLLEIIKSHVVYGVGIGIPTEPYHRLFSPEAKAHVGGPYGFAAAVAFLEFSHQLRDVIEDPWLAYVFEAGQPGIDQITNLFQYNVQMPEQKTDLRLLSLAFENKIDFVPLQAADVLAYELFRHLPGQLGLEKRPEVPRRNLQLLSEIPHHWAFVNEEETAKWAHILKLSARIAKIAPWPREKLPDDWQPPAGFSVLSRVERRRAERQSRHRSRQDP
jgi:hypothetical protein